ncbi:MAG: hypothetical protein BGO98_45545 [Myxococcales bacterium 68-20]|nr:MAG: hypothetical protein BGO98_45545 [Myxococcales bacterium 68-20]
MSSFAPFLPWAAVGELDVGAGRVLAAGGGTDGGFCEPGGAGMLPASFVAAMFGSEPRPGGGGGLLAGTEPMGLVAGPAERADGGGGSGCEDAGGGIGAVDVAGLGIPSSVFFASSGWVADTCADEAGGGGGAAAAAGERSAVFFPRPSKMSRSDPPPLLVSFDIRVS